MDRPLVHLDLKGAPPSEDFLLRSWLPWVAARGASGILVEYEDRLLLSEESDLLAAAAPGAWSPERIARLVHMADSLGLRTIPLVQTLGHAEHLLKHPHLSHLRELPDRPECLRVSDCLLPQPSSPVVDLLSRLLCSVLSLHPRCPCIHVGCDEVWHLAKGPESREAMERERLTPNGLFLRHLARVVDLVHLIRPGMRVLFWDDMLRSMSEEEMGSVCLPSSVIPVVWQYTPELRFPDGMWARYGRRFRSVMVAGAFKGASSSCAQVRNLGFVSSLGFTVGTHCTLVDTA